MWKCKTIRVVNNQYFRSGPLNQIIRNNRSRKWHRTLQKIKVHIGRVFQLKVIKTTIRSLLKHHYFCLEVFANEVQKACKIHKTFIEVFFKGYDKRIF